MDRKLATVRLIKDVQPIKGADRIEAITVDGWKVVSKKDEFKVGDKCIYFEIDSFLPVRPEFEFLRSNSYLKLEGKEGFRLRTIKLRSTLSQGLVLNPNIFPELKYKDLDIGQDVSELLGVTKYEHPIPSELEGKVVSYLPTDIPNTSLDRIQNLDYDELLKLDNSYYVTEKLDGCSVTYFLRKEEFGACSKNWQLEEDYSNPIWKVAKDLDLHNKLKDLNLDLALQGELLGPGINRNFYKLKDYTVRFFNIYDIKEGVNLDKQSFINLLKRLQLASIPIIEEDWKLPLSLEELLSFSEGKSLFDTKSNREGLVIRSLDGNTTFKVISNNFLLKEEG